MTALDATDASGVQWFSLAEPLGIVHPLHAWDEGDVTVLWAPVCRSFDGSAAPSNQVSNQAPLHMFGREQRPEMVSP